MKMESDGFALLPRQSFSFSPAMLLRENHTAVFAKEDTVDGKDVYLIKILPMSDSTEIILSNLWIDKKEYIVRKIETSTKKAGTITINLFYDDQIGYALPSQMKVSFKIEGVDIPSEMNQDTDDNKRLWKNAKMSGSVTIEYENYKVNQGIDDEFFNEEKKAK